MIYCHFTIKIHKQAYNDTFFLSVQCRKEMAETLHLFETKLTLLLETKIQGTILKSPPLLLNSLFCINRYAMSDMITWSIFVKILPPSMKVLHGTLQSVNQALTSSMYNTVLWIVFLGNYAQMVFSLDWSYLVELFKLKVLKSSPASVVAKDKRFQRGVSSSSKATAAPGRTGRLRGNSQEIHSSKWENISHQCSNKMVTIHVCVAW